MASWICFSVCIIAAFILEPATGARLTTSPTQINIGGSNPTTELTVSCSPDAPGITDVYNIEIGKKSSTGTNQLIIQLGIKDSSVQVVDTSLQQRMTVSGSITGATGSIQFILTDLRCTDAASTYYCITLSRGGSSGTNEATANITARSYPEQIEMFPSPDRVIYDEGVLISFRCTGRIGNQFDVNNLRNLWTWEYRPIDNEFQSWTRYPNEQNITYDPPTLVSGGCQYNGASTLVHTVSTLDNGRQYRCFAISEEYSANKTVYVVGQAPPGNPTPAPSSSNAGVDGGMIAGIVVAILVVIVIIIVVIVVMKKRKSGGEHYETKEEDARDERPEMTPNVVYSTPASYDQRNPRYHNRKSPNRMKGRENDAMDGPQERNPPNYYNNHGQSNPAMDDDLNDSRASRRSYDDDNTDTRMGRTPQGYGSAV